MLISYSFFLFLLLCRGRYFEGGSFASISECNVLMGSYRSDSECSTEEFDEEREVRKDPDYEPSDLDPPSESEAPGWRARQEKVIV